MLRYVQRLVRHYRCMSSASSLSPLTVIYQLISRHAVWWCMVFWWSYFRQMRRSLRNDHCHDLDRWIRCTKNEILPQKMPKSFLVAFISFEQLGLLYSEHPSIDKDVCACVFFVVWRPSPVDTRWMLSSLLVLLFIFWNEWNNSCAARSFSSSVRCMCAQLWTVWHTPSFHSLLLVRLFLDKVYF